MSLLNMDLKSKVPSVVKYFFVGGVAALTDLIIFFILAKVLEYNYLLVSVLGFMVATYVNYDLSIRFVFISGARFKKLSEIGMVYLASVTALVVHLSVLYLLIDILSKGKMISKLVAILSAFMFNYLIRRYYVFLKKPLKVRNWEDRK